MNHLSPGLDLTPSEKVELAKRIEEALGNRQGQRTDIKEPEPVAEMPQVETGKKTRDVAAEAVGWKPTTYRQAKSVIESLAGRQGGDRGNQYTGGKVQNFASCQEQGKKKTPSIPEDESP